MRKRANKKSKNKNYSSFVNRINEVGMQKTKICVIINPVAGAETKGNLPEKVSMAFDPKVFDVYIRYTGYAHHATEIAIQAIKDDFKQIIVAGGDGTVNEVAKTMVNTDLTLGIIPHGSGNGLARELGIPLDTDKALEIILKANIRTIDYGMANNHIFFCTCGFGFDAFISDKFAEERKRGPLGYVRNVLESVVDFKSEVYEIISDKETLKERAFVLTCANASQYGNDAFIAPDADIEDGKMNVSLLKPLTALEIPQTTLQLFTKNIDKNSKLISLLTQHVRIIRSKKGLMHVDGEPLEADKVIDVKIIPKGLRVYAPSKAEIMKRENENIFTSLTRWFN